VAKTLKVVCVQTVNDEKHYVVQSLEGNETPENSMDFDDDEIRRKMKKEASKPLLLLRAE
jgi:hypothetical protein